MHLNLLIFCAILSQGIIGTISSEDITESSDLLLRKKRVLDTRNNGGEQARAGEFPYIVNIILVDEAHCVGSIISFYTVITSASCVSNDISSYKISFGSVDLYRGTIHDVINKKVRFGNHQHPRTRDGIGLLIVRTPFSSRSIRIPDLHVEPLLPGVQGKVLGWGCYYFTGVRGTTNPRKLRSITVPIISHQQCVDIYRGLYNISDEDVCVFDRYKHCGHTDTGAPLIINGEVAGVYLKRVETHDLRPGPEIFVVLQHEWYREWIINNTVN